MLGWEPSERHEHYDADGNLTGYTIVTRETEWDDEQRNNMLDIGEYESGVGECGHHHEWTMDPATEASLTFDESYCPMCAAIERRSRFLAERDRKALGENPDPMKPWPGDGRVVGVRAMTEGEIAVVAATRSKP